jgi:hypothetical protein
MKFTLGFIAGLGAAWAALAIWQKIPVLGEFDHIDDTDYWKPVADADPVTFEQDAIRTKLLHMNGDCTGFGGGNIVNIHGAP